LCDFLCARRLSRAVSKGASAMQTPIPASHKSLKNLRDKKPQLRMIGSKKWRTVIFAHAD